MPQALAVIGAVTSVAGTVMSVNQQKKAVAAQNRQAQLQQRQQELATRRSQRQAIREAQILRARAAASTQALGGAGGSGAAGGASSLTSQVGGSLGFSTQMSGLSRDIGIAGSAANAATAKAQTFGSLASFGGSLFTDMGGFSTAFPNLFPKQAAQGNQFEYRPFQG